MLYHMELEERNGEQEYSYDFLIYAKGEEEAWRSRETMRARFTAKMIVPATKRKTMCLNSCAAA